MRKLETIFFLILSVLFPSVVISQTPDYSGNPNRIDTTSSIIFVGDVQLRGRPEMLLGREDNKKAVQVLLKKIADEDPSLVVILGDLTFPGSSSAAWQKFDKLAKPIHDKGIPVYPLPGNHEYFGDHAAGFEEYFSRFPNIENQLWYAKQWKDIAIITLNANFDHLSDEEIAEQNSWYYDKLKKMQSDSSIAMIIVCAHQPPFTNSTLVSDDKDVQRYFVPAYLKNSKAKLFFSGHTHSYERFKINGKDFIVSGGGGPRQKLKKKSKAKHRDLFKGGLFDQEQIRGHHYCKLERDGKGIRVIMIQVEENLKKWSSSDTVVLR